MVLWGCAVLETDDGLVHEGDFWGTGTGVGRNLWGEGLAVETWGFGGMGHGRDLGG